MAVIILISKGRNRSQEIVETVGLLEMMLLLDLLQVLEPSASQ